VPLTTRPPGEETDEEPAAPQARGSVGRRMSSRTRTGAAAAWRELRRFCRVREPFNGLSHLAGVLLSLAGLLLLLALSAGKPWHLTGFAVYGTSLVVLFSASTLYHSLHVGPRQVERLLAFDHVAIYLLIAGTYTPLCLVPLRGPWGWSLLGVVWGIALVGIVLRLAWKTAPPWLPIPLYLLMGWLSVVALGPLGSALPAGAIGWLFAGGVVYTVGAAVFAFQRPRLWPGVFGSHELWHLFVLGGSACHFVVMLRFVAAVG
jgi:hemolysin III